MTFLFREAFRWWPHRRGTRGAAFGVGRFHAGALRPASLLQVEHVRLDLAFAVALLIIGTFLIDLHLPLGVGIGIVYVVPVVATMWLPARRFTVQTAALCTILTTAGYLGSEPGELITAAIPNRAMAIVAVWVVALLAAERKRIEAALSESDARTRAVLHTTIDGIVTLDSDGRITSTNPAAEHIFGHRLLHSSAGRWRRSSDHRMGRSLNGIRLPI